MSDANIDAASINKVLGPLLLSVCINAFFYGSSSLQFAQYRTRIFRDSVPIQLMVGWTFLVDTVHTVALSWMMWSFLIDNFHNYEYLFTAPWPVTATPSFIAMISAPIQLYFASRVWTLSRSRVLCGCIVALSVANTVMGIVATVYAFTHADVRDFNYLLPIIDTWLVLSVLCDGLNSCALMYFTFQKPTRPTGRRRESLRRHIVRILVESSSITSLFALVDMVIYTAAPNTNYHIVLGIPMGRVYTCSFLAMLNAQLSRREDEANGIGSKDSLSFERRREFAHAFNNLKRSPTEVRVSVSINEEIEFVVPMPEEEVTISRTTSKDGGLCHTPCSDRAYDQADHKSAPELFEEDHSFREM